MIGKFRLGRREDPDRVHAARVISSYVKEALRLSDDDAVTVNEINCADPACEGGAETFILIMRKGEKTQATKVPKALLLVTLDEVYIAILTMFAKGAKNSRPSAR